MRITTIVLAALSLLLSATTSYAEGAADIDSEAYWREGRERLAALGRGFIVWESNRTGSWRIWRIELDGSGLRQLSPDEPNRDHFCPHISPDGTRLVYISYPKGSDGYNPWARGNAKAPLHLMSADGRFNRIVADDARAYGEDRGAVWLNAHELIYIDASGMTRRLNVDTGSSEPMLAEPYKGAQWATGWLINPTLRYATTGEPTFSQYDANSKTVQVRQAQGGCQPYFSQDGVWGFWMGGGGGPINRINLATGQVSQILAANDPRMPKERNYLYFPMLSRCGRLFAFAASPHQHDHFTSDYDIFVAQTSPATLDIVGTPVRYTFDKGCDRFPDVYLAGQQTARTHPQPQPAPRSAPRTASTGPVFAWEAGNKPNSVRDSATGKPRFCRLRARGKAWLDHNYAIRTVGGAFVAEDADAALLSACKRSNQLTLRAVIQTDGIEQRGPARIVTFSSDPYSRNFTLGQDGDKLIMRLRTPSTGDNGVNPELELCTITPGKPTHIVVTYTPGKLTCYRDGKEALTTDRVQGDFSNWSNQHLLCGNEWTNDRPWAGTLEGIAIFSRALTAKEVGADYQQYRAKMLARKPVPRLDVEARLVAVSKVPTLKEIQPYRTALVTCEYDVMKVNGGTYTGKRIRVAEWALLDGEAMPAAQAKAGSTVRLLLEPFQANPQLQSIYLADTLPENWSLKPYFRVNGM